jgi:hypothetical protein
MDGVHSRPVSPRQYEKSVDTLQGKGIKGKIFTVLNKVKLGKLYTKSDVKNVTTYVNSVLQRGKQGTGVQHQTPREARQSHQLNDTQLVTVKSDITEIIKQGPELVGKKVFDQLKGIQSQLNETEKSNRQKLVLSLVNEYKSGETSPEIIDKILTQLEKGSGDVDELISIIVKNDYPDKQIALALLEKAIPKTIKDEQPGTVLRGTTVASKLITAFFKSEGTEWLKKGVFNEEFNGALRETSRQVQKSWPQTLENQLRDVNTEEERNAPETIFRIGTTENKPNADAYAITHVTPMLCALLKGVNSSEVPPNIKNGIELIDRLIVNKFPELAEMKMGANFLFLRALCPLLVQPHGRTALESKIMIDLGKSLMCVANGTESEKSCLNIAIGNAEVQQLFTDFKTRVS